MFPQSSCANLLRVHRSRSVRNMCPGRRGRQGKQGVKGDVGTLWDVDKDTVRAAIEPEAEKLLAGIIGDTAGVRDDDPESTEVNNLESRVSTLEFLISKLMKPVDSGLVDQSR